MSLIKYFPFLLFIVFVYGCGNKGINDESKRNENWIWWVDKTTGIGTWVEVSN